MGSCNVLVLCMQCKLPRARTHARTHAPPPPPTHTHTHSVNELVVAKPKIFRRTFFQFHGAICLELTAGHHQKCSNIVSVQFPPQNRPVCPNVPVESSTLSVTRQRVCMWRIECTRMLVDKVVCVTKSSRDPGKRKGGGRGSGVGE